MAVRTRISSSVQVHTIESFPGHWHTTIFFGQDKRQPASWAPNEVSAMRAHFDVCQDLLKKVKASD